MVIPEFFENHIAEWMAGFLTLIKYAIPNVWLNRAYRAHPWLAIM